MPELKLQHPPFPNRESYPFVATARYRGMLIDLENLDGSVREGTDPNGKKWSTKFRGCHYGELRDSKGTDGDKLDIYIRSKPRKNASMAYIVHQNFPRTHPTKGGQYDEDKVILGVSSAEEAKELYLKHYSRKDFFRSITEMPIEAFKRYAMGENKGEKVADSTCKTPGKKIKSKGKGRGEARGKGKGPRGIPRSREKKMTKKEAYDWGFQMALKFAQGPAPRPSKLVNPEGFGTLNVPGLSASPSMPKKPTMIFAGPGAPRGQYEADQRLREAKKKMG